MSRDRLFRLFSLGLLLVFAVSGCQQIDQWTGQAESGRSYHSEVVMAEQDAPAAGYAAPEPADGPLRYAGARQVMRTAKLSVKVDDFMAAQKEIRGFVESTGGYVARSEQRGDSPDKLSGTLIVKVPSERYSEALAAFQKLGKVYELTENAEDVSDRIVDLQARLRNARKLEQRILLLLDEKTGTIRDVVEAERELAQVRAQIEEMDANLAHLTERVALATLTIHLFVGGSKDVEARSWYGPLLQDLRDLGFILAGSIGALLTVLVALSPWFILLWLLRRWWIKRRERKLDPNRRVVKSTIEGD